MPVGHVVVQHAGSLLAADRAPEQTGGVDAHAEDQRGRDEAWRRGIVDRRQVTLYPHRQIDEVHFN